MGTTLIWLARWLRRAEASRPSLKAFGTGLVSRGMGTTLIWLALKAFGTGLVSRGMGTTLIWLARWLRRAEASRPSLKAFGTGLVSRGMGTTLIWLARWLRRAEASRPARGRLGATSAGTDRQKVGLGRVRIGLIPTTGAMQLNATECHTKEASMPVDIELVEVDRGESCFLDRSCCRSRSSGRDGGDHGRQFRKRV